MVHSPSSFARKRHHQIVIPLDRSPSPSQMLVGFLRIASHRSTLRPSLLRPLLKHIFHHLRTASPLRSLFRPPSHGRRLHSIFLHRYESPRTHLPLVQSVPSRVKLGYRLWTSSLYLTQKTSGNLFSLRLYTHSLNCITSWLISDLYIYT